MTCSACAAHLDHCHGTLVRHVASGVDCTDAACEDTDQARHDLVVDCDLVLGDCPCAGSAVLILAG